MNEFRKITSKDLIIKHAVKEFLDRGYRSASLRAIVKKAGLTTGAFYNYYGSKEELFNELVEPYEHHFIEVIRKSCDEVISESANAGDVLEKYQRITANSANELFSYVYDHYENFMLLLKSSECTVHDTFMDRVVEIIAGKIAELIKLCIKTGLSKRDKSTDFECLKLLAYSEFRTLFSIVESEKKKDIGIARMNSAKNFYSSGWKDFFIHNHIDK